MTEMDRDKAQPRAMKRKKRLREEIPKEVNYVRNREEKKQTMEKTTL